MAPLFPLGGRQAEGVGNRFIQVFSFHRPAGLFEQAKDDSFKCGYGRHGSIPTIGRQAISSLKFPNPIMGSPHDLYKIVR